MIGFLIEQGYMYDVSEWFYYRNILQIIFTIWMHYKWFQYWNTVEIKKWPWIHTSIINRESNYIHKCIADNFIIEM